MLSNYVLMGLQFNKTVSDNSKHVYVNQVWQVRGP